ncbi:MAG: tyrosine-type recombinase/integrase [Acidimicrobiales bacterium]
MTRDPSNPLPDLLEDAWTDFARSLRRRGRSDQTTGLYRQVFTYFWRWAVERGIKDPADVTTADINAWVDDQRTTVQPSTVALRWRNLRPFFSWWAKEYDTPNPFAKADVPTAPVALVPVIADDDLRRLLATCKAKTFEDRRDEAIIRILDDCGVRLGELIGLHLTDWDRRADVLFVNGKTGPRAVPMSATTGEALARYLRLRASHPHESAAAMWVGTKGALGASGVAQMLARRCRSAGLPRLHPHQLRHSWAHGERVAGLSEGDLMYLAGWKSSEMAHRYGASAAAERAAEAKRRLGRGNRL